MASPTIPTLVCTFVLAAIGACRSAPDSPFTGSATLKAFDERLDEQILDDTGNSPATSTAFENDGLDAGPLPPGEINRRLRQPSNSRAWQRTFRHRVAKTGRRWVRNDGVAIRSRPSPTAPAIGRLYRGDIVIVESVRDSWARLKSGVYIRSSSLAEKPIDMEAGAQP